jgi:hypothetical protein
MDLHQGKRMLLAQAGDLAVLGEKEVGHSSASGDN